jgi:alkylation response protein AidB-like acyl-CoA dehydrogenase
LNDLLPVSSSSAQLIPWVTVRISRRCSVFENVSTPRNNLLGKQSNGLALTAASFTGTAALVGILGVALMRAAFDFALHFARTERRGGIHPIIEPLADEVIE